MLHISNILSLFSSRSDLVPNCLFCDELVFNYQLFLSYKWTFLKNISDLSRSSFWIFTESALGPLRSSSCDVSLYIYLSVCPLS